MYCTLVDCNALKLIYDFSALHYTKAVNPRLLQHSAEFSAGIQEPLRVKSLESNQLCIWNLCPLSKLTRESVPGILVFRLGAGSDLTPTQTKVASGSNSSSEYCTDVYCSAVGWVIWLSAFWAVFCNSWVAGTEHCRAEQCRKVVCHRAI